MRRILFGLGLASLLLLSSTGYVGYSQPKSPTELTLVFFADYHAHVDRLAKAVGFLKDMKAKEKCLVVASGGDLMNEEAPAFSGKHRGAELVVFNGLVDVSAVGNHEYDYPWPHFQDLQKKLAFPFISANLAVSPTNQLVHPAFLLKDVCGTKVAFVAAGGGDVPRLTMRNPNNLPPDAVWLDATESVRKAVQEIEAKFGKDVLIIFIGHQAREDDAKMAEAIPQIAIFAGTHSHYKRETSWTIGKGAYTFAVHQYLTGLGMAKMAVQEGRIKSFKFQWVPMDERIKDDPAVAARIRRMMNEVKTDPKYKDRFAPAGLLGKTATTLEMDEVGRTETTLGNWVTDVMRRQVSAHVAVSSSASFRKNIAAGEIDKEAFFLAVPYVNKIVTAKLTGAQLKKLVDLSVGVWDTDKFSQQTGLRFGIVVNRTATASTGYRDLMVLKDAKLDPANPANFEEIDEAKAYVVATTNFQALVLEPYKSLFAESKEVTNTNIDIHQVLMAEIAKGPLSAKLDGRMKLIRP
jgi:5'-nucleotidase